MVRPYNNPIKKAYFEELTLLNWITESHFYLLKMSGIDVFGKEIMLPKPLETLKREVHLKIWNKELKIRTGVIGKIDLLFRYKREMYCCEIKCQPFTSSDFWDALKIIGYTAYYNWWKGTSFQPAVLIPKKQCRLECFIVARQLKLKIFSFEKDKYGKYMIKEAEAPLYNETKNEEK